MKQSDMNKVKNRERFCVESVERAHLGAWAWNYLHIRDCLTKLLPMLSLFQVNRPYSFDMMSGQVSASEESGSFWYFIVGF